MRQGKFIAQVSAIAASCLVLLVGYSRYSRVASFLLLGLGAWAAVVVTRRIVSAWAEARELGEYDSELRRVCPGCGYDMRATPLRCPECGREPQMTDTSLPPRFFESQPRHPGRRG